MRYIPKDIPANEGFEATMSGFYNQMDELSRDSTAMGKAFDEAKNDESFYLPPEVLDNPDFQRGMKSFFPPDGKTVQMIIAAIPRRRRAGPVREDDHCG